jgi:hypothetical protein
MELANIVFRTGLKIAIALLGVLAFIRLKQACRPQMKNEPLLFTEEFVSALPELSKFENSQVVLLCKDTMASRVKIRNSIEIWFRALDEKQRAEMMPRLRSQEDPEHLAAFFELALWNYFQTSQVRVEKDPLQPDGTTPDFRLSCSEEEAYVEVRTITSDPETRRVNRAMNEALDQIDKIATSFQLSVHFEDYPQKLTKPSALRHPVEKWLVELSIKPGEVAKKMFYLGGYDIELTARNQQLAFGAGKVVAWSDPVRFLGKSLGLMHRGIKKKSASYKPLQNEGKPYIVAICSTDPNYYLEDLWMTLVAYGTLTCDPECESPSDIRVFDLSQAQTQKPGLSGILHCVLLYDRENFTLRTRYFANPSAKAPVPECFGLK